tara:strand:+ start:1431 stop:2078 length:648 start_codon:yes stop_codon:yes gene_type:complete
MPDPSTPPTGTFEAHLTVPLAASGAGEWAGRFEEVCDELGLKPLLIEAAGAASPLQPMASAFLHGTLSEAEARLLGLAKVLAARGFPCARLKLEAVGRANPYLPERASDQAWGPSRYFEFHLKVHLRDSQEVQRLASLCAGGEAHLSRNPRRAFADGACERFVTLRLREVGKREAAAQHTRLCHQLTEAGFAVTPGTIEFALVDTCVALDAGWAS